MFKKLAVCLFIVSIVSSARAQQPAAERQAAFISPDEVNVSIGPDVRQFVVMAAINIAGFDYESGNQKLSPARAELRRDLANLNPQVKQRLAAYYNAHRRAGVDEASDAMRYAALSLLMSQPPAFSIYKEPETLPPDLRALLDFVPLVADFYVNSGIKALIPKYTAIADVYASAYRRPVGELIAETVEYLHARPETTINMRALVVTEADPGGNKKKEKQKVISRARTRGVFIIPDPLSAVDTSLVRGDILNQKDELTIRKVGDDYIVVVGPSRTPNLDAVRQALIRFIIDPILERHLKASLEFKEPITQLAASVPTAGREFGSSVYLVLRESLAYAAEARMRRIQKAGSYSEDEAVYDLAQAYLRGAVLAFHFYDSLKGLEKVGIGIEDFFDQMVATTKFDREAARAREFEPVVARVASARASAGAKSAPSAGGAAEPAPLAKKIILSDDLIRQRRFAEARGILEEILAAEPNNARALYGMAQTVSQVPSRVELDAKADEDDKIQAQYDRLEQAVKLYRKAIEQASKETELWLIQWSHVLIGRIRDFQEFRPDAIAEYEKAIALGELQNGAAYREALEGKKKPFGQK